jgi:hypothetical protein
VVIEENVAFATETAISPLQHSHQEDHSPQPLLLGLFHRQIEGDHHLLELAQRRYSEAGLGAEFYPGQPGQLQESLEFRPLTEPRYTVHLPRHLHLLDPRGWTSITAFAGRGRSDAYGLIIHDHQELATKAADYLHAIERLNELLLKIQPSPYLFIEYAVGLDIDQYAAIFEAARQCERVSACIDISHVGIRQAQRAYAEQYPGQDVCELTPDSPELPARIRAVVSAAATALPVVLDLVRRLGELGKPLHFHLHDGHPLSTFSRYGVSDHLSFQQEIRLPFEYEGQTKVPLLFGPEGLQRIVATAKAALPGDKLSFMLEIHPQYDRLPLGPYLGLFKNWKELHHAEQMNAWLDLILANLVLLQEAWWRPQAEPTAPAEQDQAT